MAAARGADAVQQRFIAKLLLGALVVTALIIGLVLWEPLAGFGLGALLFHGYLTVVMKMVETYNERLYGPNSPTDGAGGGGGAGGAEGIRSGAGGDGARSGRGRRR